MQEIAPIIIKSTDIYAIIFAMFLVGLIVGILFGFLCDHFRSDRAQYDQGYKEGRDACSEDMTTAIKTVYEEGIKADKAINADKVT